MNKASIVVAATFAALAAPSAAIASPTSQAEAVQQEAVTVEPTDEIANNYVDRDNIFVFESVSIIGNESSYVYHVEVPECYSSHAITAYIEHADGSFEQIKRYVPQEPGTSDIAFSFDVNGRAIVTVSIGLYDNEAGGHVNQTYDPKDLERYYREFAVSTEKTSVTASNDNISAMLVEMEPSEVGKQRISATETVKGSNKYLEYASGYFPPVDGGVTLGSFRYAISPGKKGEGAEATAGFTFTVDKKYAGWSAIVYMDIDEHFYVGQSAAHEVTISEDGTFTVPYAMLDGSWSDDQGNQDLRFVNLNRYLDEMTTGVLTVVAEPINIADNGAIVDFNGMPQTVQAEEGASFTVVSSDVSVNIAGIGNTKYNMPNGYEWPREGGEVLGFFSITFYPFGEVGNEGEMVFKIDVGTKYAGRTATLFKGGNLGMNDDESRKTFVVGPDGIITITEHVQVLDHTGSIELIQNNYAYAINIEPADTVSLTGATVSAIPDQTWSGSPVTPQPTVTLDGKVLADGTDYDLSYENNDKPGTGEVVITGKGAYSGTIRVEFQIVEKGGEPSGPSDPTDPDTPDTPDDPDKPAPTFPDVTEDAWYFEAVTRAAELGVMNGYSGSDRFGPLDWLTREQAAAVMFNYLGDNDLAAPPAPQKDVLNDWYTDAVNWAVAEGVMGGYAGTNLFGIGQTLTREEFCAVIANAAGADLDKVDTSVLDRFADGAAVSAWSRPAVAWAVEAGIMNGVALDDGSRALQATRGLVRAEMAAMTVSAIDAGVLG